MDKEKEKTKARKLWPACPGTHKIVKNHYPKGFSYDAKLK
jgi:hypothetical protein